MNRNDADTYFSIIESPHEGVLSAIPVQSGNKLLHQPPSGQAALATANRSANDMMPARSLSVLSSYRLPYAGSDRELRKRD